MLILCINIFVELEHFILFNNLDKYHNFIYYRINMKVIVLGSPCQDESCCKYSILSLRGLHGCYGVYVAVTGSTSPPPPLSAKIAFHCSYGTGLREGVTAGITTHN